MHLAQGHCKFTELTLTFLANFAALPLLKRVCKWLTSGPKLRAQSSVRARRRDGGNGNGSGGGSANLSVATCAPLVGRGPF
jgi:hypothetical protein